MQISSVVFFKLFYESLVKVTLSASDLFWGRRVVRCEKQVRLNSLKLILDIWMVL